MCHVNNESSLLAYIQGTFDRKTNKFTAYDHVHQSIISYLYENISSLDLYAMDNNHSIHVELYNLVNSQILK